MSNEGLLWVWRGFLLAFGFSLYGTFDRIMTRILDAIFT